MNKKYRRDTNNQFVGWVPEKLGLYISIYDVHKKVVMVHKKV
jgi:hypothetical protein